MGSIEQILLVFFTICFEFVKGRALDTIAINHTTLPPVIWPTVESGLLLLRPAGCTPELRNCSNHGACALHGKRPVCLCVLGYHGDFCENKTSPVPPLHVASFLFSILIIYVIIHAACVIHRSRCQRLRSTSLDSSRRRTDIGSYGSIGEHTNSVLDGSKKTYTNSNDETQTTTPTGTLSR